MKKSSIVALSFIICHLSFSPARAQNPFVQTWFTSDPAPMVHDGTMYVYTGHDEDGADFFWMQEWRVYSTKDMVNWQDHGSPLALESFSWADDRAWASQCIERDGKFFWYICAHSRLSGGMAIGVAVADSPTGPFRDALGKPLFENGSWDHIDPTVMIDDDGQAWLMWGNPRVYYLKLNRDMISYEGEVGMLPMTEEAFGGPVMNEREKDKQYKDSYVEGPWLMKAPHNLPIGNRKQGLPLSGGRKGGFLGHCRRCQVELSGAQGTTKEAQAFREEHQGDRGQDSQAGRAHQRARHHSLYTRRGQRHDRCDRIHFHQEAH
jgi:hypothetical protein